MSDIYDRLKAALDTKLVPALFAPATIRRSVPGSYNPVTMRNTVGSTQSIPCEAVARVRNTRLDNGVLHTDTVLTLTVEPRIGDTVAQGDLTYTVRSVETVAPIGEAIVFRAVVTR